MSEYPDPDEEFELFYGDELELLREQDEFEEPSRPPPPKSRRTLDFNTIPSTQTNKESQDLFSQNQNSIGNNVDNGFSLAESVDGVTSLPCGGVETEVNQNVTSIQNDSSLNNKKRTVEDLFGDIDDLEDFYIEDTQPLSKKQKTNELEEDLALIEHIVQLRKLAKEKHSITNLKVTNYSKSHSDRDKQNLSFRVPKYPFIGVTRFDKERVYVRFHSEDYEKEETARIVKECTFKGVMGDSFKEAWKEAERLINNQINMEEEQSTNDDATEQSNSNSEQLWVDLYKPRKYLELLSDESTNRIMLRWIKLWDKCVFNRKPKIKPIKPDENPKNKFNKFFKMLDLDTTLDEHGRPKYKVALLCGPPGLGKTTLAHMVAKHAGYNVVEINASDDRSTDAFKTALENATQMRSVVDREGRPNCLVFDEIDGAPQSSIDFLIKFVNGIVSNKPKKGKAQKQSILKRPIICICNDVYVPALRALRQIAFVVNFPLTSGARLAERLMEIARRQQIKTDLGAMMALAEKSNKDVRTCLSVLHFYKAQGKAVTLSEVYKSNVGQKDMQKGLFAVWQDIFLVERSKSHEKVEKTDSMKTRMSKVLQVVSSFGDYDRLAQGVFENFPKLKLKDSTLEALCRSLDWFIFSDLINKQIYTLQNYELMSYLQYAFVVWHFIFATSMKQKLNYPSAGYEARQKENQHRALVSEVLRGLQPRVRPYCQRMSLILDIIPLLLIIVVPNFRPVSLHLYTKEEKENMLTVVNIMIDYNLNYVQERSPDGTFSFNLEPNIEDVVTFDKANASKRKALSYSNKQLIAREVELEKLRRIESAKNIEAEKATNVNATKTVNQSLDTKAAGGKHGFSKDLCTPTRAVSDPQLPNHLQKLQAKTVKVQNTAPRKDFFGRVIPNTSPKGRVGPEISNDIWYQYKEGYSNAVRKTITVSYLK